MRRLILLALLLSTPLLMAQPVPVIFDTDTGNDIDDVLALSMLHALESRGEIKLLGITITKDHPNVAPFLQAVNTFYGRPDLPLGMVRDGVTREASKYVDGTLAMRNSQGGPLFPRRIHSGRDVPEATEVLRRLLRDARDNSVVIVQVGFSTNLAHLLRLPADQALVERKVRLLVTMFGRFPFGPLEYNVKEDVVSAQTLVKNWPTPIIFSGFEIGRDMLFPARSILNEFAPQPHPVVEAYKLYMKMPYDRETWDLTAVLYAARPEHGYFNLSEPGTVLVDDRGATTFERSATGKHRYMYQDATQRARTLEAMILLASEPPHALPAAQRSGSRVVEVP